MKTNAELQTDVQNAIKWEPLLHDTQIGVTAKNGVVSLTGEVDSLLEKAEAEHIAKKIIGVKALIQKIEVKIPSKWFKTDSEIVDEVLKALKYTRSLPKDKVTIKVEYGRVFLGGDLPWNYQREDAQNAVRHLSGVKGVTNNIIIKSESNNTVELKDIEKALKRNSIDDSSISVKVSGTTVTLSGIALNWYQKEEAGRIAWKTPGIEHVSNELEIDHYYESIG